MEFTDLKPMQLPASYAVLSEDEMVYIEGGAFELNITKEQVINFSTNVVVNSIRLLGQAAVGAAIAGMISMHNDGLTVEGSLRHYWDGQSNLGKAMTFVAAGFAGVYAYLSVARFFNTVLSIYQDARNSYNETTTNAATSAAATPALAA